MAAVISPAAATNTATVTRALFTCELKMPFCFVGSASLSFLFGSMRAFYAPKIC